MNNPTHKDPPLDTSWKPIFPRSPLHHIAPDPYPIVQARLNGSCDVADRTGQHWAYCIRSGDVRRLMQDLADSQAREQALQLQLNALQDSIATATPQPTQ
jgi:hypothetical protein